MIFDPKNPLNSDPYLANEYANDYVWCRSEQENVYYSWVHPIADDVSLNIQPLEVQLGYGALLYIFFGPLKQEFLYRLVFNNGMPERLLLKPSPYCLFWSFGTQGGASKSIKYHYRDRFLSAHEWTDKASFLAVLRQQHYIQDTNTFWSR